MKSFSFYNPVRLVFGRGSISQLPKQIPLGKRILAVFGGGSVKSNGVYQQFVEATQNYFVSEYWGIEPNPKVEQVREAVLQARKDRCDFVLAVGGGSVIDACKLISAAILSDKDAWDIVLSGKASGPFVPLGTILTLPATGSEMNSGSVISSNKTLEKYPFRGQYPAFSVLDPTIPMSLPTYQIACGIADSFVHVMEQYLTVTGESMLMDRWAEGILTTLIEIAPRLLQESRSNEDLMAEFMISATMALNGFISWGVSQDWSTHAIGHEITALSGLTHGHSLALLLPSTMKVMKNFGKKDKMLQYAQRIWHIEPSLGDDDMCEEAIAKTKTFFASLGFASPLSENGLTPAMKEEVVRRFKDRNLRLGEHSNMDYSFVSKILEDAY